MVAQTEGTTRSALSRVWWLCVAPNLLFLVLQLWLGTGRLIGLFNAAIIGLSVAAMVAYHRGVWDALTGKEPLEAGDYLTFGVFLGWFGNFILRGGSTLWRMAGRPDSWEVNPSISYALFVYTCAGVFHLAAQGAINHNRVPTKRWVTIGAAIGLGVFASVGIGYVMELSGLFQTIKP